MSKSLQDIVKEAEERWDAKFPYQAVEYGKDYEVTRNISAEQKEFFSAHLTIAYETGQESIIEWVREFAPMDAPGNLTWNAVCNQLLKKVRAEALQAEKNKLMV